MDETSWARRPCLTTGAKERPATAGPPPGNNFARLRPGAASLLSTCSAASSAARRRGCFRATAASIGPRTVGWRSACAAAAPAPAFGAAFVAAFACAGTAPDTTLAAAGWAPGRGSTIPAPPAPAAPARTEENAGDEAAPKATTMRIGEPSACGAARADSSRAPKSAAKTTKDAAMVRGVPFALLALPGLKVHNAATDAPQPTTHASPWAIFMFVKRADSMGS
mmetsp:Transcript_55489/g.168708  ORF Transcript_55489/g.168708 Transcript_55489/m.168708 type:complete len:223 (-) Transcript_55489:25-693(-)